MNKFPLLILSFVLTVSLNAQTHDSLVKNNKILIEQLKNRISTIDY